VTEMVADYALRAHRQDEALTNTEETVDDPCVTVDHRHPRAWGWDSVRRRDTDRYVEDQGRRHNHRRRWSRDRQDRKLISTARRCEPVITQVALVW